MPRQVVWVESPDAEFRENHIPEYENYGCDKYSRNSVFPFFIKRRLRIKTENKRDNY